MLLAEQRSIYLLELVLGALFLVQTLVKYLFPAVDDPYIT